MAYVLNDEEDFNSSWKPQQAQPGGAGAPATGTAMASAAAAPAPTGSRFVSFDRYLGANSEAAAKTGEKLGYAVQQKGDAAKQAMDDAGKKFGEAAIKGMGGTYSASQQPNKTLLPPSGPATVQQQGGSTGSTIVTRAAQPLTAPGYSLDEAKALAGTTYTGPKTLAEFAPQLRGQVEGAQRTAAQLGNEQGRRALLAEGMGRQAGAYSGAMAGLDEALATGSGTNREKFGRASDVYGRLNQWLGEREVTADRAAKFAQEGTQKQAGKFAGLVKEFETQDAANKAATANSEGQAAQVREVEDYMGTHLKGAKYNDAFRPVLADFRNRFGRMPTDQEFADLTRFGAPTLNGGQ